MWGIRAVVAVTLTGLAMQVVAENLVDVLQLAKSHDARWASAQAVHRAGQEKASQGAAALYPTLSAKGSYEYTHSDIEYEAPVLYPSGSQRYENGSYGLNLTQPVYRRSAYATFRQSQSQAAQADAQLRVAESDFLQRVAQSYFEVLVAQESLALASAEVAAFVEKHDQASALFKAGATGITDLIDAKARLDLARAREIAAKNEVANKRQALRRVTLKDVGRLARLRPQAELPAPVPDSVDVWIERAHSNSPAIQAYAHARRAAEWDVERSKGEHHPTLDLVAGYTRSRSTGSPYTSVDSNVDSGNVGLQLQVPLFQGGLVTSRVREAMANLEKVSNDDEDARRDIESQVRNSFLSLLNGRSQIQALQQAEESSAKLLEASIMGRRAGIRTWVDVLNAEQQVYSTKRDLTRARYEYLQNFLKLKALAGSLVEKDIIIINELMDISNPDS